MSVETFIFVSSLVLLPVSVYFVSFFFRSTIDRNSKRGFTGCIVWFLVLVLGLLVWEYIPYGEIVLTLALLILAPALIVYISRAPEIVSSATGTPAQRALFFQELRERKERAIRIEYPSNWDNIRRQAYTRDKYTCQDCGATNVEVHAHHIDPLSSGGTNELSNLKTLCLNRHAKIHPHMREQLEDLRNDAKNSQERFDDEDLDDVPW